ncbi:hypothetical protein PFISCL1PPCAC_18013, partial [Pristionchus fissidentatus]
LSLSLSQYLHPIQVIHAESRSRPHHLHLRVSLAAAVTQHQRGIFRFGATREVSQKQGGGICIQNLPLPVTVATALTSTMVLRKNSSGVKVSLSVDAHFYNEHGHHRDKSLPLLRDGNGDLHAIVDIFLLLSHPSPLHDSPNLSYLMTSLGLF